MEEKQMDNKSLTSPNLLHISEVFASIQGEGVTAGTPSVFVRFSGCNLQCKFCDTPYTWNFVGTDFEHNTKEWEKDKYIKNSEMSMYSPIELSDLICKLAGTAIHNVVLTGGEPLLYSRTVAFVQLLRLLKTYRFNVEVETNGTILPVGEGAKLIDRFNVSPKLSNSGMVESRRIKDKALLFFADNPKALFKFVVMDKDDVKEITVLQDRFNIPAGKILLMPEGRTEDEIKVHSKMVVDICMSGGYTFCNRLHIWLWGGAVRGI